jgi:glycerophosphoryl diester phosphodiesterase
MFTPAVGPRSSSSVLRIAHYGRLLLDGVSSADLFERAETQQADVIELDVRTTFDDQLVMWHNPTLPSGDWIADLTLEQIRTQVMIETVADALLNLADSRLGVYFDTKTLTDASAARFASLLDGSSTERVVVASHNHVGLLTMKSRCPDVTTSLLFASVHEDPVAAVRSAGASFAHPCWEKHSDCLELLSDSWIARVRSHGYGVVTWHEERREHLRVLLQRGVDGICTDDPALLTSLAL